MQSEELKELLAEMKNMRAELRELKSSGKGVDRPEEVDMSEDNEDQNDEAVEKPTWLGVLAPTRVAPQVSDAVCLANLLVDPPPLDRLKPVETNRMYEKVPETPPPRKNRVDQNLFVAQRKLEQCMHLLVHYCESGDRKSMVEGAAFCRSAWEDLQQQRRGLLAGKQSFRLEPRVDNTKARLLTKEEEAKLVRTPRPTFRRPNERPTWMNAQQPSSSNAFRRSYSGSRPPTPKGKGKGKGKGQ